VSRVAEHGVVPSRRALDAADRDARTSAAGLHGYLSEDCGFLPRRPPSTALPPSHRAWDDLARDLPVLFRTLGFRAAAHALPRLDAGPAALPDDDVRRATTVLGILAHSWHRVEPGEPPPLPEAIARPWAQVCARLGRPRPFLEFEDITTANWRLVDPEAPDPLRVENLDLLVPTVGNEAERCFMMTLVELAARATPMVGAVVRAQESMVRGDRHALEAELVLLVRTLRSLVDALRKADPNPSAPTYVDPVVWGTTVAPFAVSLAPDVPSPGGTAAPLFQVLDAFLGRHEHASVLGREVQRLHDIAPPLVRSFVRAIAARPLAAHLERTGAPSLRGVARELLDVYAGEQGLLQLHRIKAYGYLEVAFKVGRPVTLSGFEGVFRERPWKRVDAALDASARERGVVGIATWTQRARLAQRGTTAAEAATNVQRLVLDVRDQGIVFDPGDRVAVVPQQSPILVARVFEALRVEPGTEVELTAAWRAALARQGFAGAPRAADLFDFLRRAELRPLARPVAKALHAISQSATLGEVVEERLEDQLDLADALAMMTEAGYDVRRLTAARPWQSEGLAAIVPPGGERLYSISSAPTSPACQPELVLTVGEVAFTSSAGPRGPMVPRYGVGSRWLTHRMDPGNDRMPLRVVRPRRFQLPADPARPIVMFAGGTGISPFVGFLAARGAADRRGAAVLFLSVRRIEELWYRDELDARVRAGELELHVAVSREDRQIVTEPGRGLVVVPGEARRVRDLVEQQADRVWALLGDDAPGVGYVCGQAGFAHAVLEGLRGVAASRGDGPRDGHVHVRELVGRQRLMLDVFTTTAPVRSPGPLGDRRVAASELVTRNDDDAGYWMAIDGGVYDVTEFRHLHPGGPHILVESAGTDATDEYRAVLHHLDGEVGAMLAMFKVGLLRRLRLGDGWGVAATADGLVHVSTVDLYRAWVRGTYLAVEMQNAHRNDWSYRALPLTRGEVEPLTAQKLMLMANTHDRFVVQYLEGSLDDDLVGLWTTTTGLCGPDVPIDELPRRIAAVRSGDVAAAAADVAASLRRLPTVARSADVAGDDRFWTAVGALWDDVRSVEARYLARLKDTLRQGLVRFEEHEGDVVARAGGELVEILLGVPAIAGDELGAIVDVWHRSEVARRWC
jgi:sulfite reductase alpha subunit-like flavoprotein